MRVVFIFVSHRLHHRADLFGSVAVAVCAKGDSKVGSEVCSLDSIRVPAMELTTCFVLLLWMTATSAVLALWSTAQSASSLNCLNIAEVSLKFHYIILYNRNYNFFCLVYYIENDC
jgi:hypothetical protein